jgi:phosphotransferase system  glucose/maltose/N-acetylglucosamine-specific IIC component
MKKGELAINVVVMAVVALLVLVVLAIILVRSLNDGSKTATQCTNANGVCDPSMYGCKNSQTGKTGLHYAIGDSACSNNGDWCCVYSIS